MKLTLENKLANLSSWLAAAVLVLAPFWAFISVALASVFGYYTAIRLVIELALVLLILAAASLLVIDKSLATKLIKQKWFWPVVAFIFLEIIWGIVSYFNSSVSLKALGYAWIVDLRYLLFFVVVYLLASKSRFLNNNWPKLVLIPAGLIAIFAVLQFAILPLNFLNHFGYSKQTIFPYETINNNKSYVRAMSFTRGANPLGAYLLIVVTLLAALVNRKRRLVKISGLILALAALIFSFSRSAWLGVIVSLILLGWMAITSAKARKLTLASGLVVVIILALAFAGLHNNSHFQSYFLHTSNNSTIKTTSDQGHLAALKKGFSNFASDPLGNGPGTSGPASLYNHKASARNSENYYLMIGQEDGWLGLAVLLVFFAAVAVELARARTKLALALFASFIGLAVVNFLLPAWTDVTLAYVFWGLAGIASAARTDRR